MQKVASIITNDLKSPPKIEGQYTVKKAAEMLGYKQASPFIETFSKQFGYSPGTFKMQPVI
jgi:AraC-like DNA-binding protein